MLPYKYKVQIRHVKFAGLVEYWTVKKARAQLYKEINNPPVEGKQSRWLTKKIYVFKSRFDYKTGDMVILRTMRQGMQYGIVVSSTIAESTDELDNLLPVIGTLYNTDDEKLGFGTLSLTAKTLLIPDRDILDHILCKVLEESKKAAEENKFTLTLDLTELFTQYDIPSGATEENTRPKTWIDYSLAVSEGMHLRGFKVIDKKPQTFTVGWVEVDY